MKLQVLFLFGIFLAGCGGGGGGGGDGIDPGPSTVICLDGTTAPIGLCTQVCADGNRIPEFFTCRKTCTDGRRIPETSTCTQQCEDGSTLPEEQSCAFRTSEYSRNYGLRNINAEAAYLQGSFGQGVTVAVVDSGLQITHNDLENNVVAGEDLVFPGREVSDPSGHGTAVGGIIAATQGNREGGHGVAPQAKLMPLKIGDSEGLLVGDTRRAFQIAVNKGVQIVNNSYGGVARIRGDYRGTSYQVNIPHVFSASRRNSDERTEARNILNDIRYSDIVMVWSAGNNGWQPNGRISLCSDLTKRRVGDCESDDIIRISRQDFIDDFVSVNNGSVRGLGKLSAVTGINRVFASRQSMWPYFAASTAAYNDAVAGDFTALYADDGYIALLERWLSVVALDRNNQIASYSNGCGNVLDWCLAAPASGTYTTDADSDDDYRFFSGTSAAAPHVSGALAVLRSNFPDMPMSVIRAILLTTATDLGRRGRDGIYGWGLVNLSAAINLQNSSLLVTSTLPDVETPSLRVFTLPRPNFSNGFDYRNTEFNRQYGLARINADHAYQRGYFGQGVTVAVLDTGMLTSHVDLRDNVVPGYDFAADTPNINDPISSYYNSIGHGSFVAGIIAASRGNSFVPGGSAIGMHGVAPMAKLMPLQFGDFKGALTGDQMGAFRFAVDNNVRIINNSWGGISPLWGNYRGEVYQAWVPHIPELWEEEDRSYLATLAGVVGNSDTIMVWAAGNNGWREDGNLLLCGNLRNGLKFECGGNDRLIVTPKDFVRGFYSRGYTVNLLIETSVLGERHRLLVPEEYSSIEHGSLIHADISSPGLHGLAPAYHPELQDRWLVVVATDADDDIASFSNGCGIAKNWCLAAPGVNIFSVSGAPQTFFGTPILHRTGSGTSFAAPHVSGALALLKSRLPTMPMSVIRAILLTTATDLGAPGIDEAYGWGLVNVGKAITLQGRASLPINASSDAAGILLADARIDLPPGFSAVAKQLESVEVAVGGVGDAYWNMPLSDIVEVESAAINIGDAAADMLTPVRDHRVDAGLFFATTDAKTNRFRRVGTEFSAGALGAWRLQHSFCDDCERSAWREWSVFNQADKLALPFFAGDDKSAFVLQMQGEGLRPFAAMSGDVHDKGESPYQQFGLRWQKNYSRFGVLAEASEIHEDESFMGTSFGALGQAEGRTKQGRVMLHGDLSADWRGFVGYERAHGEAEATGLLSSVSGLRADGWSLGMEKRDTIGGGMLRFSARRETAIRSGRAVLRYTRAEGNFTRAFYSGVEDAPAYLQGEQQTLETRQSVVNLSTEPTTIYTLGYTVQPRPRMQLAVGAEYETANRGKALSMQLQMAF